MSVSRRGSTAHLPRRTVPVSPLECPEDGCSIETSWSHVASRLRRTPSPGAPVKEVLVEALAVGAPAADDLEKPVSGWLDIWYRSPSLTVLNAVWPPHISLFPHNHRMWAAIGIYGGQEDNTYYRRQDGQIVVSGGKELHAGQVLLLGDDAIHAVRNPLARYTGAVHVYGGDFVTMERSQWDPGSLAEEPYDLEKVRTVFDQAQRAFERSAPAV